MVKCTVHKGKKGLSRRQGQGTTNEAGGRMAQSAATGFPISTAERFSVQPGAAPTGGNPRVQRARCSMDKWICRLALMIAESGPHPRLSKEEVGFLSSAKDLVVV